jgi:hypothetical protein
MAALKTLVTDASVMDFVNALADEAKKKDSLVLLELFEKVTDMKPKMWGTSIIGYGVYHYKSERSRQEGDWPLVGFSPRKQNLSLYVLCGFEGENELLDTLGKHKRSVGCLYVNKLADIDLSVLEKIIKKSFLHMKKVHGVS